MDFANPQNTILPASQCVVSKRRFYREAVSAILKNNSFYLEKFQAGRDMSKLMKAQTVDEPGKFVLADKMNKVKEWKNTDYWPATDGSAVVLEQLQNHDLTPAELE